MINTFLENLLYKAYGKSWAAEYYSLPYKRLISSLLEGPGLLTRNVGAAAKDSDILRREIEREVEFIVKAWEKVERRKGINKESTT